MKLLFQWKLTPRRRYFLEIGLKKEYRKDLKSQDIPASPAAIIQRTKVARGISIFGTRIWQKIKKGKKSLRARNMFSMG